MKGETEFIATAALEGLTGLPRTLCSTGMQGEFRGMADEIPTGAVAHLRPAEALRRLPGPAGERFIELFRHGSLTVELYAPRGQDPQTPHTRDELYVIVVGSGRFFNGTHRHPFAPGDCLFVAAGTVHRFEEFSDDLVVWVVFYGPEGGETA